MDTTTQSPRITVASIQSAKQYIHWGGPTSTPIPSNTTRMYYQNINGVGTRNLSNGFVNMYTHMKSTESAICCYTETNLDWTKYWIKQINEDHGRKLFHNAIFGYACHNTPSKNAYKPGGTMMVATGQLASRHLESGTDASGMGRYSFQTFTGANGTKLMFVTVYRTCFHSIETAGETTSYYHQWHNLLCQGYEHPNPRKQVLIDLKVKILSAIGQGIDVCVSIDANEELNSRNHQFSDWIEECGLISVHENFFDVDYYDTNAIPSTYGRGDNKIDYVLCTPRLFSCIENVSIEAMNSGIPSDHRALIVDFNTDKLLGKTMNIAKNKTRKLKSHSRKASSQYRNELYQMLTEQNIFSRVNNVVRIYENSKIISKCMDWKAEQLDKYITSCMVKAEEMIKSYNTEDFSPEKAKRADIEKFWKLAEQAYRKNENTPTPPMETIVQRYPNETFENMEVKEAIYDQLKLCREHHKKAIENSKELRRSFLIERAEIAHLNGDTTAEAAIIQLKNIEDVIITYNSLRRVMNPSEYRAGLSTIKVPQDNGEYTTIVDPKEIEEKLLERNRLHYGQAENTEMASQSVREKMGTTGTSEFCDEVMNGEADLSDFSPSLQAIFQQLENPPKVEVNEIITLEDFKDTLKCWKEKTSTSPSGRHLGHYISLMTKIGDETDSLGEEILEMHHKMLVLAQYRRKPYERWKKRKPK
jgi:hypothetical protein